MLLAATNRRSFPLHALALMVFLFHFLPGVSHAQKKETYRALDSTKTRSNCSIRMLIIHQPIPVDVRTVARTKPPCFVSMGANRWTMIPTNSYLL